MLKIDILVGQDYYHKLVKGDKLYVSGGLVLVPTISGYCLAGEVANTEISNLEESSSSFSINSVNHVSSFVASLPDEINDIKQFSSLENLGIGPLEAEISPVLDRFNHTTTHNGERYSVILPKRPKRLRKLPSNGLYTFGRLLSNYANLSKAGREEDLKAYSNIMTEQLESNVLERVTCIGEVEEAKRYLANDPLAFDKIKVSSTDTPTHYLPNFGVKKKSNNKLRLVYDAAAKSSINAYSLNSCLETGPDLMNSLLSILIRFRTCPYALKSDIRKAFLQKNKFCTGGSELWFATQFHVSHPSINTLQHAITLEVEHRVAEVVGKARQVADRYSSNLIAQFAFIEIIRANKL